MPSTTLGPEPSSRYDFMLRLRRCWNVNYRIRTFTGYCTDALLDALETGAFGRESKQTCFPA